MRDTSHCKFTLPLLGVICCLYSATLLGCQSSKKVALDFQNTRSKAAVGDAEYSAKDTEESVKQLKKKGAELTVLRDNMERTVIRTESVSRRIAK